MLALHLGIPAHTNDFKLARKTLAHTLDHVLNQRTRKTVQGALSLGLAFARHHNLSAINRHDDGRKEVKPMGRNVIAIGILASEELGVNAGKAAVEAAKGTSGGVTDATVVSPG